MSEQPDDDMKLPPGKTCNDCQHMRRCSWLIQRQGHETTCDWAPSRFVEITERPERQPTLFDGVD